MRLVVTGGGTGGHLFPALCVAEWAQKQGDEVFYFGSRQGLEGQIPLPVPAKLFDMSGLRDVKRHPLRSLLTLLRVRREAYNYLEAFQAKVVFGTGGYVAAPILMAQRKRRRPYVLFEPDAMPGSTNRWLARSAACVCLSFGEAAPYVACRRQERTGLPVRPEVFKSQLTPQQARTRFDLQPEQFTVLIVGGSQGALALNEIVLNTVQYLPKGELQWLHLTGTAHFEAVQATANRLGLNGNYQPRAFLEGEEMGHAYRAADMAVARAGAGTLTEIALNGLPAIFVPYPYAARDHQRYNCMALVNRGAAVMILQSELTPARLSETILQWRDCPEARLAMGRKAREWAIPDATERIYEILKSLKFEVKKPGVS